MKVNYQIILDKTLQSIIESNKRPKLLLHSCCAPCSSYVLNYLSKFFDITIYYYNPNIDSYEEFTKRSQEQIRLIKEIEHKNKIDIIDCDYENNIYENIITGLENEPEGGKRCQQCFILRLEKTAKIAKKLNYNYFSTTLTVSPHKNAALINNIGYELEKKYDINWLPTDYKKEEGYKKSIELSKKYNLYRQDYCGCKYSVRKTNYSQKENYSKE